jgi:hypothetical protein
MDTLERLAKVHQAATHCDVSETIAFLGNVLALGTSSSARLAQDAAPSPVPLDPDLLALAQGSPSNIVQQIYQLQEERNQARQGGDKMNARRMGRGDRIFSREADLGTGPQDYIDPENGGFDQGDPDMDPQTLMQFVELCKRRLMSNDAENETDSHNQFMNMLAEMVAAEHAKQQNGNGDNGLGRRPRNGMNGRGGADQYPQGGTANRPPMNGVTTSTMDRRNGNGARRPAQDAALVSSINTKGGFLRRFPMAGHIKFAAHGRY